MMILPKKRSVLTSFLLGTIFSCSMAVAEKVKEIRIEGNRRIESETILSYLPMKLGDEMDELKIDQALKDIYATGYFMDVNVEKTSGVLTIKVQENAIINKVAFEGNKKFKDDK